MKGNILNTLSMTKYERILPRLFPDAIRLEIVDREGAVFWCRVPGESASEADISQVPRDEIHAWADVAAGLGRRQLPGGEVQIRTDIVSRSNGRVGWLIVAFNTSDSVPLSSANEPLRRAFADSVAFLQEEIDLQSECNQLAIELTERYEELNLVYSTKDQVEHLEEGHDALVRLVQNCADYLDVGLSVLICRDKGLLLHHKNLHAPDDSEHLLDLLAGRIYDRVRSRVQSVVLNETDKEDRERLFGSRPENLVAYPVIDDHGTAIGLLAVAANPELHTFSNGDRNLLEVMAKKASRIIHTHHDSLTGLMNRSGFESSMVATLATARSKGLQHCLLHIDIDQLHVVNDLMGHEEGDKLIRRVAKSVKGLTRDTDFIARFGGDEFGVLLTNCSVSQGHKIADDIRNAVHRINIVSAKRQLEVSASIGIAAVTSETEGIVGVMASAEIACKAAKEAGRDRIQVFEEDNTTLVRRSEEVEWIGRVQEALRDDLFRLYCQPVLPIAKQAHSAHYEILVRMAGNDGDILSPAIFMPAAERYQLMPMLDRWVIHNTLRWLGSCWAAISACNPVFCINLSGQSLTNPGFPTFVLDEINSMGVPPENICFEITETAAISNIDEATAFMQGLREIGCSFSLDDFGAGLSSFGYLKNLPVDYLKIDGSFVREMRTDPVSRSMVTAICQIAKTMKLATVAEFVGDEETIELLRQIEVDFVQGYYIGEPEPLDDVTERLQNEPDELSA
ncbi:MAG: putative bifunctional diguanylate cyclase/phosphodiesterase [Woeseiaceae bacterium]